MSCDFCTAPEALVSMSSSFHYGMVASQVAQLFVGTGNTYAICLRKRARRAPLKRPTYLSVDCTSNDSSLNLMLDNRTS